MHVKFVFTGQDYLSFIGMKILSLMNVLCVMIFYHYCQIVIHWSSDVFNLSNLPNTKHEAVAVNIADAVNKKA